MIRVGLKAQLTQKHSNSRVFNHLLNTDGISAGKSRVAQSAKKDANYQIKADIGSGRPTVSGVWNGKKVSNMNWMSSALR